MIDTLEQGVSCDAYWLAKRGIYSFPLSLGNTARHPQVLRTARDESTRRDGEKDVLVNTPTLTRVAVSSNKRDEVYLGGGEPGVTYT
jgi:hypothetical protein